MTKPAVKLSFTDRLTQTILLEIVPVLWEEVNRRGSGVPGFRIASKQQPAGEAHRSMALRRFARIHWRCLTARALVGCADRSPQAVSAHTGHCRYRFRPPGGNAEITAPVGRHAPARRRVRASPRPAPCRAPQPAFAAPSSRRGSPPALAMFHRSNGAARAAAKPVPGEWPAALCVRSPRMLSRCIQDVAPTGGIRRCIPCSSVNVAGLVAVSIRLAVSVARVVPQVVPDLAY